VSRRPIVLAKVSDVHAGGTTALCPEVIALDDGGEYRASKLQRWLFQCWQQYWARVDDVRTQLKAELYTVFNGDLVDGAHHGTTQVVSNNPNAQAAILNACMAIPLALKPDRIAIIRGTEAHVGQSASAEERIADGLRRDKRPIVSDPDTKTASWWHWRPELQGVRLDITHHGRAGQRQHTEASAMALYAHDIFLAHAKDGDPHPHLSMRGHHHRWGDSYDAAPTRVARTGAWQMGTSYVKKVAADTLTGIGGAIVTIHDGEYEVEKMKFKPTRPTWRP
jgi:hypothetical protein